ncbi:alpha/beta fold hydrolase [Microlunatus speluncae]|uniref:alpha/beta fold hydrolase n=1 Tax=Microlunatus speluncae TaxID=2594267 RepID=UPI0013759FE6|nr:alpha/beta fold hydrolase [Microlunatus speluncae]
MTRRKATDVAVDRVYLGDVYARVSTVGDTGTRAFVLVPGIGVSANYFEQLAAELNEFGPVVALDLPGFGGVPHPRGRRFGIGEYAELVGTVIERLGLRDPILVGHSMGTQIVAELAARSAPGTFRSVVLLGPVINPAERRLRTTVLRFLQSCRREPPRVALLAIYAYLLCGPRWFARTLPEMLAYRIEETLPKITASTLIIAGEHDRLCPRPWLERAAELLPRSRIWIIPDGAHSVMHAQADQVAQLCVEHARHPDAADEDEARVATDEPDTPDHAEPAKQLAGQAEELIGIVTDDDALIAAGKTKQAEALDHPEE